MEKINGRDYQLRVKKLLLREEKVFIRERNIKREEKRLKILNNQLSERAIVARKLLTPIPYVPASSEIGL